MSFYRDQVLPRVINIVLNDEEFASVRARVAAGLAGEVLEVGFGSGLNVPLYPRAVTRARAVDPATVGRKLAAGRVAASAVPVEYIGLDGQALPLAAGTIDHVLVTWTLCTIPAVDAALGEMFRVLRPGGQLHFAEHGRSNDPRVAKWQDRLTPFQRHLV
jgi:ubiquinone/menaquinone biosynthesis C-methylase UbiE